MALRIHHLNCGTMCPACARLVNGEGGFLEPARMICHVLLIETPNDGLVLVDTGLGLLDVQTPKRLGGVFRKLVRPQLWRDETAIEQVRKLGYAPEDVRHLLVTHLDVDHASGLPDFPAAEVHVFEPEFEAAMNPQWRERSRYLPVQWAHSPRWVKHAAGGESWFGLEGLRPIPGLREDILLVPLIGHSRGHCGVAVRSAEGWLLHCGDAYFFHAQMHAEPHIPLGLSLFERIVQSDRRARLHNAARLRELAREHRSEVELFCAHDAVELERMQRRTGHKERLDERAAS